MGSNHAPSKIVCTLGPATDSYEQIKALIEAGMDVARLNLSHGTYAEHEERYQRVRKAAGETGRSVGVLADLQGPKIRLGRFREGPVLLERGDEFTITVEPIEGDRDRCGTTYEGWPPTSAGASASSSTTAASRSKSSMSRARASTPWSSKAAWSPTTRAQPPGVAVSVPAMSEKDVEDLRWALRIGADVIALSFVRNAKDVVEVHRVMEEEGIRRPVIAKVEKPQAVDNLAEIVDAFDGIMVARGDLGVEMPLEAVPIVQKRAIKLAKRNAKPVIVATQMLDSMIENSRPTRAEASDVANAVIDGTDAVMLSGETSVGKYPIATVKTMGRIVAAAEQDVLAKGLPR
ncbi:pyruvate kinase [Streptomyces sp. M19]